MNKSLNIVIVGASRGIGYQVASKLLQQGHNLFCISRNKQELEKLKMERTDNNQGSLLVVLPLDILRVTDDSFDLFGRIKEVFSRVDILLNNAGLLVSKGFDEFSREEMIRIFDTNFFSPTAVIRQLLPLLGGDTPSHIVNTGSMGGFQGSSKFRGLSYYSASKAALACFSECLAEELRDKNIKVNCLALGAAQTEMLKEAFPGYKAPLTAGEMAEFICSFMVSGHKYFNGKVLPVSVSTP